METRANKRKMMTGVVISDKMDKTCVVQIRFTAKHKLYDKPVRRAQKFKAHDEQNKAKVGDKVRIMETRPLSKDKRWIVQEIIEG